MHRFTVPLLAVAVLLGSLVAGSARRGVAAQDATPVAVNMVGHPVVGAWRIDNPPKDPIPATYAIFHDDGTYLEVTPPSRLVWTNEEGGEGGPVTTVIFEEKDGKTLLVMRELHSSKEALDAAGTGAADAMVETFAQLDELLLTLGASVGRS